MQSKPKCITVRPLVPLQEEALDAVITDDFWTLKDALFILHGYTPLGHESDELLSLFPYAYNKAKMSATWGRLREIKEAGKSYFCAPPADWLAWAQEKQLPVPDIIRQRMTSIKPQLAPSNMTPSSNTQGEILTTEAIEPTVISGPNEGQAPSARPGRPSRKAEIVDAYEKLRAASLIDFKSKASNFSAIRKQITGSRAIALGLGDQAIRTAIGAQFDADKAKARKATS